MSVEFPSYADRCKGFGYCIRKLHKRGKLLYEIVCLLLMSYCLFFEFCLPSLDVFPICLCALEGLSVFSCHTYGFDLFYYKI